MVRVPVSAQYELVVQHAPSKADFFRFRLNVSAARAHATRTLATGLLNELTAGSSYAILIAPYDIFGYAADDTAARIVVSCTAARVNVSCCERQPDGQYKATVTLPGSVAYTSFDVCVQLQEKGGTVNVVGSPMAVVVTDEQGRLYPEEGNGNGILATLLVAGAALLVLSAVVAIEVVCWSSRRTCMLGTRIKSQFG